MKLGLLQLNVNAADLAGNAEAIFSATQKAAGMGADLCLSSELVLCGCPPNDLLLRPLFVQECQNILLQLALRLEKAELPPVLVGAPIANPAPQGKPLHNCAVLLRNGKMEVIARKVLLPADGTHDDHHYFEAGVSCGVLQYKGWRFAVSVGEDVWNDRSFWQSHRISDTDPIEEFMGGGADALLNLTGVAYAQGLPLLHKRVLAWTASHYRIPVVSVNQIGGMDSSIYNGGSMVFNGYGKLVDQAALFKEDVRVVDLATDCTMDVEKQPESERSSFVPSHIEQAELEAELWEVLLLGTRDFVRKSNFHKVLLGLSGGIDSALVATIATEALGSENVLGVLLPSPYTSQSSIDDALHLAKNLGIGTNIIPISSMMQSYADTWQGVFESPLAGTAAENLQARIRGDILMGISNTQNRMLLATSNKSEIAVGYSTLYGDMCGGLEVIGDLYKTQVFSLCRWINSKKGFDWIPVAIIEKEPTAELRPDQKDSDSLPPYSELDALLHCIIEQGQDSAALIEIGYDEAVVKKIVQLIRIAEFKRYQAPPTLNLSTNGFGGGWHMPISGGNW